VYRFDDAEKAGAARDSGSLIGAPIAAVTLAFLRDPLGFRAPVG
jgi:hypothetical protein